MNSDFSTEFNSYSSESGPPVRETHTLDIKRFIRLRAPIVIAVSLLLAIPAVIAAWFLVPLEYEVAAQLRFLASAPKVMEGGSNQASRIPYEKYLNTEMSLITGPAILSRVLQDPAVQALPEIVKEKDPYTFVREKISVRSNRNSELVSVSFRLSDKESAKLMVNTIIDTYRTYTNLQEAAKSSVRLKTLYEARTNAESRLSFQQEAITGAERGIGRFDVEISSNDFARTRLADAQSALAKAQESVSGTERQLTILDGLFAKYEKTPDEPLFEISIEEEVTADRSVSVLSERFVASQANLAALRESRLEGSKELIVAKEQHETLAALYLAEKRSVRDQKLKSKKAKLQLLLDRNKQDETDATTHRDEMQKVITDNTDQAQQAARARAELNALKMKAAETQAELKVLRETIGGVELEDKAPARMSIASDPIVPIYPDRGKLWQFLALIIVGACSIGMGVGVILELNDQQTRTPQDLAAIAPIPLIGAIPDAKSEQFPSAFHAPMLVGDFPNSPSADQYRRVVARIAFPPDGIVEVNSCLIVSPTRGDGKTTLACNLAIALAQANRRVLVIDICPLDPSIEWCFGLEPQAGLAEVLFNGTSYETVARNTEFQNLLVMGPGLSTDELRGKLASREMMELLEDVEKDFDHIIIDSPPALFMADAKFLAPVVDGVIVVVGAGVSTRGMIKRCVRELEQANSSLIGFVLNKIRPTRGGYLRDNMDMFYRYAERNGNGAAKPDIPEMEVPAQYDQQHEVPAVVLLAESDEDIKNSN